jgi:hypothetical protein
MEKLIKGPKALIREDESRTRRENENKSKEWRESHHGQVPEAKQGRDPPPGRYAGRKGVIIKTFDHGTCDLVYCH